MTRTAILLLLALGPPLAEARAQNGGNGGGNQGPLERNCGDAVPGIDALPVVLPLFTDPGEEYESFREWPVLPPSVPSSVVTNRQECSAIVDVVNPWIQQHYPPGHDHLTEPLLHYIYRIGPYAVIVYFVEETDGWYDMLILDGNDLTFLWSRAI